MDDDDDWTAIDRVEDAESYERIAAEFPYQRGFLLLNAADAWIRADRRDRAVDVLTAVVAGTDEPAGYARVELADIAMMDGRQEDADRLLTELARDTRMGAAPCKIAAIVLANHADRPGALRWYDHYVGRLAPVRISELRGSDGGRATVVDGLRRRRDLRRDAGLLPDALDDLVEGRPPQPQRIRVLQRAERAEARCDRPAGHPDPDEVHYPAVERLCLAMVECGVPRVTMTTGSQRAIRWPPQRNAPCWCGSGRRYKVCCRQVGLPVAPGAAAPSDPPG